MSDQFHGGVASLAGTPEPGGPLVEWVRDGVLLVRGAAAQTSDPWIIEAAARVAAGGQGSALGAGRTAVVLVPPLGQPLWRLAERLAEQLPSDGRGIILISGATAVLDSTGEVPAQVLADTLAVEVLAPDGPVLAIPDGSLFVLRAGARAGWWRFRRGTVPVPIGPRYPVPVWQSLLAELRGEPPIGLVLDQVPAGLWMHTAGAAEPGDMAYAAVADPWDLTLVVSRPGDRPVPVEAVGAVLAGMPPELRARTVVSLRGPLSYPSADMGGGAGGRPSPGWVLSARLGEPVRCNTGLPMMVGDVRQVAALTPSGEPTWRPFAQQMRYLPAPETTPEVVYWRDPAPRFGPGTNGMVALDRRWVVEVVEAGLWVRPTRRPVGGGLVRRLGVDPNWCLVVLGDLGDSSVGLPWRVAAKLLRALPPDARARVRAALPYNASEDTARRAMRACGELLDGQPVHRLEWDGSVAVWPTQAAAQRPESRTTDGARGDDTALGRPAHSPGPARPPQSAAVHATPAARQPAVTSPAVRETVAPEPPEPAPPKQPAPAQPVLAQPTAQARPAAPPGAGLLAAGPAPKTAAGYAGAPLATSAAVPAAQPTAPAQPVAPVTQPAMPAVQPAAPATQPAMPAVQPAAPATQPAMPAVQPAAPVTQPAMPAAEPAAPATQPAMPAAEPAAPATQAAVSGVRQPAASPTPIRITAEDLGRASSQAERTAVRAALGWRYDAHAGAVNRMLAERPGLRFAYAQDGGDAVVTELVAVRAYLADEPAALVETMRTGAPRVDLATVVCVASGLRRLAAHPGPVFGVLPAGGRLPAFRPGTIFHERGFAVASPDARVALPGEVELVLWSVTGRRLAGLGSPADDDVVFPARARFLVLATEPLMAGARGSGAARTRVYACELAAAHAGMAAAADRNDERIIARLRRAAAERDAVAPEARIPAPAGRLTWMIEVCEGDARDAGRS